ncbi:hypothetical protein H5410_052855 [Solanum commersonii]|uniref:Uncharacterized protein n=1 Tax=Solanum commersonii TaxID=4109 RepID=A0A9J5X4L3_SOLCO|nr:hypothetical protein H5410_052855 [Solanum commersonii]
MFSKATIDGKKSPSIFVSTEIWDLNMRPHDSQLTSLNTRPHPWDHTHYPRGKDCILNLPYLEIYLTTDAHKSTSCKGEQKLCRERNKSFQQAHIFTELIVQKAAKCSMWHGNLRWDLHFQQTYQTDYVVQDGVWPVKNSPVQNMKLEEMRMLKWMCRHTRRDRIRNKDIRGKAVVAFVCGQDAEVGSDRLHIAPTTNLELELTDPSRSTTREDREKGTMETMSSFRPIFLYLIRSLSSEAITNGEKGCSKAVLKLDWGGLTGGVLKGTGKRLPATVQVKDGIKGEHNYLKKIMGIEGNT